MSSRRRTTRSPYWSEGWRCEVDVAIADANGRAAILRKPLLGDVHPTHHLHSAYHFLLNFFGKRVAVVEHAVDPHADHEPVFVWLNMNVGCIGLGRLEKNEIDELDDRRPTGVVEQIFAASEPGGFFENLVAVERVDEILCLARALLIGLINGGEACSLVVSKGATGRPKSLAMT